MRVVKLDPVTSALLREGQPLVDDQRGRVGQYDRLVCRAEGRAAKRPAVVRTDDGSVDATKGNGVHTATIGIKQRHRVSPLAKAKVGTNAVRIPRATPDAQQARLAKRCPLGQRELVATAIAKHPALEVDLRLAKVSQLNEILLGAVRRSDMHLVDDHGRSADAGSRLARRTGLGRAGRPVGRRAGISQQIDQLQRMTVAVGQSWPGAAVAKVHLNHPAPVHVEQGQPLATIGQTALVPAVDRQPGVAELERVGVVVRCQNDILTGGDRRVAVEGVVDTVEPVPAKRHLGVAAVVQLHKLVLTATRRIVHDLGKAQRCPGATGLELMLHQSAPLAAVHRARADDAVLRQLDRRLVLDGTLSELRAGALADRHLGVDEHVGAAKAGVQSVNREDVVSCFQFLDELGDIKNGPRHGGRVVVLPGGAGVPARTRRAVSPGDANAVEECDKPVVILHPEHQEVGVLPILGRHAERNADKHRLVDAVHVCVHVDADVRPIVVVFVVPDPVVAGFPVIVVERLIATVPVCAEFAPAVVHRRNERPLFSIARENGLATLSHGARLARIGSVERVINVAGRRSQLKFITGRNRAAILAELRCVVRKLDFLAGHLAHHDVTPARHPGTFNLSVEIAQRDGHGLLHFAETAQHVLVG